ncbi:SUKH-4 family immunity protein [Streptomyces xiamenensis]|uniref:ABC transport protein n=1 Tax=Streptomyces xiamenensis TaxID=408015 RepID=A0A0F7G129_9ACTN|nr:MULTISPECIES: SUKH-4 family immunity protein [Streptomyces]AKG46779.1 ABC transport protein [Streptomyces xiamenensis]
MDDTEMAAALAGCVSCPYPGTWQGSPFAERTVGGVRYGVVALDPGLSALGVRRADGSLWGLPEEGVPHLVNSGVEAFVAFTRAYEEAAAEADAYAGPDEDGEEEEELTERAADALTDALLERFAALDAEAVADENSFWCVAAEELGYGMGG